MKWIVFDAMGVVFEVSDDTNDLLVPFVRERGGCESRERINELYRQASLGQMTSAQFWREISLGDEYPGIETEYLDTRGIRRNGGHQAMTNEELIRKAQSVVNPRKIAHGCTVGDVGCALITGKGNVHVGVCIDVASGIGFCAEHSAIAAMVTQGEQRIRKIVAVLGDGTVLPPCGRCREFMHQVDQRNMDDTDVILSKEKTVKLRDLLPHPWEEVWEKDRNG